jgi:hypothetical protein
MSLKDARWETLSVADSARSLADNSARHAVSAKRATTPPYEGWLFLKVHSAQAGWTHLALAPNRTVVAQGYGADEASSFATLRAVLDAREARPVDRNGADQGRGLDYTRLAKQATRLRERMSATRREGDPGQRGPISGPQLQQLDQMIGREHLLDRLGLSRSEAQTIITTAAAPERPEIKDALRQLGREYVVFTGKTGYASNKFRSEKLLAGAIVLALAEPHVAVAQAVMSDTELAERASDYLTTDHVRPAQAAVYRGLLTSGPTGDPLRDFAPGLDRRAVISYSRGDLRMDKLPEVVRERLQRLERQIESSSHRWPKGMLATALALTHDVDER